MSGRGNISRGPRKYVKEASDIKSEENKPLLKFNFNGGLFSAIFLSEASFTYLRGPRLISPPLDADQTKQRAPLKNIYIFPVYCCVLESFFNKKRSF